MKRNVAIVVTGIVSVAIAWPVVVAAEPEEELAKQLRVVMVAQIAALNREDADEYQATMHSDSPVRASTISGVKKLFEKHDMKYEFKSFTLVGTDADYAYARVSFTTTLIGGPKLSNKMDQLWALRKEKKAWKFWNSVRLSVEELKD